MARVLPTWICLDDSKDGKKQMSVWLLKQKDLIKYLDKFVEDTYLNAEKQYKIRNGEKARN